MADPVYDDDGIELITLTFAVLTGLAYPSPPRDCRTETAPGIVGKPADSTPSRTFGFLVTEKAPPAGGASRALGLPRCDHWPTHTETIPERVAQRTEDSQSEKTKREAGFPRQGPRRKSPAFGAGLSQP